MKLRTADLVIVVILVLSLKGIIMNQLTLSIDVPPGIYIDLNKLEIAANEFIQKYIGQMVLYDAENNVKTKRTHSFRKLRGVILYKGVNSTLFNDLEDSYQYEVAIKSGCNYLITGNLSDYKNSDQTLIKVLSPQVFLMSYH